MSERRNETIYIAGPMRGYPRFNFDAFYNAAHMLFENGWNPINPAELDVVYEGWDGYPPEDLEVTHDLRVRCMRRDLNALLDLDPATDAIGLLPGWSKSSGARVEYALAKFLGLEVVLLRDTEAPESSGP